MLRGHSIRSVATVAFAGTLLLGSGCGEQEPEPELPPRAIRWMEVTGDLPKEERVISGIVTAVDETSLAFEVGGTVLEVPARLGDEVKRGDVLALLDPEPFELAVRDAEAELADIIARGEAAEADYQRTLALFEADVVSRQELDRDSARRKSTASRVDAARARLNLAQRDLRRSVLRAPFDGSISVRNVEPAMKLASGETAFEMDSRESGLRIEVQIPETLIARVERGAEVGVRFPSAGAGAGEAPRPPTRAEISEVGTRAGSGNAFTVRADFVEQPPGVKPGMTAEIELSLARMDAASLGIDGFLVPFSAVHVGENEQFSVFVFDEGSSSVHRRPVETGGVRDNDVAVLSGLEDGDVIATAGVSFLSDGQTVRLLDAPFGTTDR